MLPAETSFYDIVPEGLAVGIGSDEADVVYPLETDEELVVPRVTGGSLAEPPPALLAVPLLFDRVEVPWDWWVATWEGDRAGKPHPALPVPGCVCCPGKTMPPCALTCCARTSKSPCRSANRS